MAIILTLILAIPIAWMLVSGIDNMKKNHPDYKGDDFLNWDNEEKENKNK